MELLYYIIHMAADTHVDNSIKNPVEIIHNNITSTVNLLEYARSLKTLELFFYFITDSFNIFFFSVRTHSHYFKFMRIWF